MPKLPYYALAAALFNVKPDPNTDRVAFFGWSDAVSALEDFLTANDPAFNLALFEDTVSRGNDES